MYPSKRPYRRFRQLVKLGRHWKSAQSGDHAFAGEAEAVRVLLGQLGVEGGYVVDIAASDGVDKSSTLPMFRDPAWAGLAVEMDPEKFAKMAFAYASFEGVQLAKCKVTPRNVADLLRAHEVPRDLTYLNLDIDSYDLFVLDEMLKAGFRPRIVSMEINENIPPPIHFTVRFDEHHYWHGDHFFGCSIAAACAVVKPHGYVLESVQYNNAVFVEAAFAAGRVKDLAAEEAYRTGYLEKPDRRVLFSWNAPFEDVLTAPPEQAVALLERHFEKYRGLYDLRVDTGAGRSAAGR